MTRKVTENRDPLDQAIARTLRDARIPRGVPIPGPGGPTDDEILRYVEGIADLSERRRMDDAMPQHPDARSRVEILRESLAETGQGPSLPERAARYVFAMGKGALEFLRGATAPLAAPSVAWATRSSGGQAAASESFYEFLHAFGDLQAHIKVEHVASARIDVQVTLEEKDAPVTDARVTLTRGGQVVDSLPVEESGTATLSGLEPACYELEVRRFGKLTGSLRLDFLS